MTNTPPFGPAAQQVRFSDDSYVRLHSEYPHHTWSYDFVHHTTEGGRSLRLMTLVDEFSRQYLAIKVGRRLNSMGVIEILADAMLAHSIPKHVYSNNGVEMTANIVRDWLGRLGARALFVAPDSPWENGYCESFNNKLRDELLNGELFHNPKEARVVTEQWRQHYNTQHPHSSLG